MAHNTGPRCSPVVWISYQYRNQQRLSLHSQNLHSSQPCTDSHKSIQNLGPSDKVVVHLGTEASESSEA